MPFPAILIVSITAHPLLYMFCLKKPQNHTLYSKQYA